MEDIVVGVCQGQGVISQNRQVFFFYNSFFRTPTRLQENFLNPEDLLGPITMSHGNNHNETQVSLHDHVRDKYLQVEQLMIRWSYQPGPGQIQA